MNAINIANILEQWQKDGRTKTRGVFVYYFSLQPQAQGFMIDLQLHEDGVSDPEMGDPKYSVYGKTLPEVFANAVAKIEERKAILMDALK